MTLRPFDVFDEILAAPLTARPIGRPATPQLRHMSRRDEDKVMVRVELPGVRAEDLELSCVADAQGTVVDLAATRKVFDATEKLSWSARLAGVDPSTVVADLADGVLELRGELTQPSARRVPVNAGSRNEAIDSPGSDRDGVDSGGEAAKDGS